MYKFFIKKNFFDGWDNMINIISSNLVILGVVSIFIFSAHYLVDYSLSLSFLLLAIGFVVVTIFTFAFGKSAKDIAEYKVVPIKNYFKEIPHVIKRRNSFFSCYRPSFSFAICGNTFLCKFK